MHPLPPAPWYVPYRKGRYRTSPDLFPLGTDLGGGALDRCWLQWDAAAPDRALAKRDVARGRRLDLSTPGLTSDIAAAAANHLRDCIGRELPSDRLPERDADPRRALADACAAVAEDVAVAVRGPDGLDRLAWLHVAFPSRWAPEEKLGATFEATHAPVPGMARSSAVAARLFDLVRERGPQVRFAWGIAFDPEPDQHPSRPAAAFDGRRFWIRVERQVLAALPVEGAAVFTIRVHVHPSEHLQTDPDAALGLVAALRGMSEEARAYKGLADTADAVADVAESFASGS